MYKKHISNLIIGKAYTFPMKTSMLEALFNTLDAKCTWVDEVGRVCSPNQETLVLDFADVLLKLLYLILTKNI